MTDKIVSRDELTLIQENIMFSEFIVDFSFVGGAIKVCDFCGSENICAKENCEYCVAPLDDVPFLVGALAGDRIFMRPTNE